MFSPKEMRHLGFAAFSSGQPPIRPAGPGCKGGEGADGRNVKTVARMRSCYP